MSSALQIIEMAADQVRAIPIHECGEPLIDVSHISTICFGEPPECPETAPHYRLLRQEVLKRLKNAQLRLPAGLRLRIYEGYRSPEIQNQLFQAQLTKVADDNQTWSAEKRYLEASKLASPLCTYAGDLITTPHSTGGAVDVEIVDAKGALIDFGMKAKDWSLVEPELCATRCNTISSEAQKNRALLVSVLEMEGFVNYPREWWHFSYGDQYWAANLGLSHAIYGRVVM
jgi:D-alanyl-D-alanine dipeptidase